MDQPTKTNSETTEQTAETADNVQVLCTFGRTELEKIKQATGVKMNATAVASFCRINLQKMDAKKD